jgi:hypothetical protein
MEFPHRMSDPRHHHYVPQGYLRGFATGSGRQAQVYCIDLLERRSFTPKVRNIAGQRDFNRVELDGVDPNILEKGFAHFEGDAVAALRRIEQADSFADQDDRALVLNLIALLAGRNPRQRSSISDFMGQISEKIMRMTLQYEERWRSAMQSAGLDTGETTYEQMKDFVDNKRYTMKLNQNFVIGLEQETMVDTILHSLADRNWHLARSERGYFITSDHPVCLVNTKDRGTGVFSGPGFGLRETAVIFPLNKHQIIMGTFEPIPEYTKVDYSGAARFNTIIISSARRQVYAVDGAFPWMQKGGSIQRGSDLVVKI